MIALTPLIALIVPVDAVLGLVTHVAGLRGEVEWVAMRMMFGFVSWAVDYNSDLGEVEEHTSCSTDYLLPR